MNVNTTISQAQAKNTGLPSNKNHNASANLKGNIEASMATTDTASFSAESMAMLSANQTTTHIIMNEDNLRWINEANERRAAAGLPLREIPESFITEREFTIFSRNALEPHMEDADRHLALMRRAILDPSRFTGTELTLAERTVMRESMLLEAKRIADKYLSGEDAQRFVEGFQNLIHEAELVERGYIRDGGFSALSMIITDNVTFRRPVDAESAEEYAEFEENSAEVARQIAEVKLNFHKQLNLNGIEAFRSVFEQLSIGNTDTDSPAWQWLMQLQIFRAANI